jgi:ribose 5-phosphate isomerase B
LAEQIRIALAADHAGFGLKEQIRNYLVRKGIEVEDLGPFSADPVDYPDMAAKVAARVAARGVRFGVLVCGTGLGMAMAANKVPGVRAATCNDTLSAHFARAHNDANVLTMGGRLSDEATARKILDVWLATPFEGGRHARRVCKIATIDEEYHSEKSE